MKFSTPKYIPKGSMCTNCSKVDRDCSKLLFKKMPVIEFNLDAIVVKCSYFERNI